MREDVLYFKRNYSINPILHEHIHLGGEFTILPGQTWEQVAEATLGRVHEFALKHFPSALEVQTITSKEPIAEVQVDKAQDKISAWIQVIELTSSIPALERFKPQVDRENNQSLTDAYNKQYNFLTNK